MFRNNIVFDLMRINSFFQFSEVRIHFLATHALHEFHLTKTKINRFSVLCSALRDRRLCLRQLPFGLLP